MQNNILNKEYHTAGSSGSADAAPRMTKNKQCAAPRMTVECGRSTPSLSLRGGFANEAISCRLPHPIGLAMTGYKKCGLAMTGECGRSMVEMLGVLAVMGVLSVAGIAGYNSAMNKHRANELLNESSKRAVVVAGQLLNRDKGNLSEFTKNTFGGAEFATGEVSVTGGKFEIKFVDGKNPDSTICSQMLAAAGDNSIMTIAPDCSKITFNKDLTKGEDSSGNGGNPDDNNPPEEVITIEDKDGNSFECPADGENIYSAAGFDQSECAKCGGFAVRQDSTYGWVAGAHDACHPVSASPLNTYCIKGVKTVWFDVSCPLYAEEGGGGDNETYANIRAAGYDICSTPTEIKCEAERYPGIALEQVGQNVNCDLATGFTCRNDDQPGLFKMCLNYLIQITCP